MQEGVSSSLCSHLVAPILLRKFNLLRAQGRENGINRATAAATAFASHRPHPVVVDVVRQRPRVRHRRCFCFCLLCLRRGLSSPPPPPSSQAGAAGGGGGRINGAGGSAHPINIVAFHADVPAGVVVVIAVQNIAPSFPSPSSSPSSLPAVSLRRCRCRRRRLSFTGLRAYGDRRRHQRPVLPGFRESSVEVFRLNVRTEEMDVVNACGWASS